MSKICRKHFKHFAECPDITVNLWMKCLSYWAAHSKKTAFFPMLAIPVISSETQRKSVGLGKTGANVFKDGWESPWDATLKKASSTTHSNAWLCLIFLCQIKDKHLSRHCRELLIRRSLPAKLTVRRRSAYMSGLCRRAFFQKSFQRKWGPQNQRYPII